MAEVRGSRLSSRPSAFASLALWPAATGTSSPLIAALGSRALWPAATGTSSPLIAALGSLLWYRSDFLLG